MAVRLIDLRKSYGSVEVLRGINLEFRSGEIHALLGANGAGKSTLLGCMSGATQPSAGTIQVDDRPYAGFVPRDALAAGISIIYQHFQLAPSLSVSDNVFLGDERQSRFGFLSRREQARQASEVLRSIGLDLDPSAPVEDLSVGQQQGVEIARSLRRNPRLLILDEPTAALGKHEVDALLRLMRRLAHDLRVAVIFVTHLLGEVMEVADRISILAEGRVLWTKPRHDVRMADMVAAISPSGTEGAPQATRPGQRGDLVTFDDFATRCCGPLDLKVRAGEIVGVYGMLGSGRTDLLETLAGARLPWAGRVNLGGKALSHRSPAQALAAGVALVASDRLIQSLFATLSAQDNLMMPQYGPLSRIVRRFRKELAIFRRTAEAVNLHPAVPTIAGSAFSGGNAQKLMVGRWLTGISEIRLLLLDEPTQGVDIGSRAQIYNLLRSFAGSDGGRAVLFATSDPEEALLLADRICVLVDGKVAHIVEGPISEAELVAFAQGIDLRHRSATLSPTIAEIGMRPASSP